jgi:adenosylcobinamide-GDP ribazoletransferase
VNDRNVTETKHVGWVSRLTVPPIAALQFLTVAPPIIRRLFTLEEMGRAVGYFPLIGALLGSILATLYWGLAYILPGEVATALVLAAWVYATGALHLDGFLDTCDGLFGGHTPEDRLHIMRDERIGAFAMAGGGLLLICKYAALANSPDPLVSLLLATTLARWAMSGAIVLSPYARPRGLGRAMKDHSGGRQLLVATVVTLSVALAAGGWMGLVAAALVGVSTWLAARFALRRLPGLTGDVYGAICELIEALVLVFAAALPA